MLFAFRLAETSMTRQKAASQNLRMLAHFLPSSRWLLRRCHRCKVSLYCVSPLSPEFGARYFTTIASGGGDQINDGIQITRSHKLRHRCILFAFPAADSVTVRRR